MAILFKKVLCRPTFLQHKSAWMIEEKVPEVVAIGIHSGLLAQAGGPEELEGLQGAKGRLALGHRHRAAGHCK